MVTRPVIILGAPRAGTSVLGRLLEAHPEFVHVKEPRFVWRYGNDHLSDILPASAARQEVVKHIHSHFDRMIGDRSELRLLEKTPSNSLRVPFIDRVFPDAQYVHITRNGYDAALSIRWYWQNFTKGLGQSRKGSRESILAQRLAEVRPSQIPWYAGEFLGRLIPRRSGQPRTLWGPRLPGMRQMLREMDLLEVAGLQWRTCVERARIDGPAVAPGRYYEVRLEDLNEDRLRDIFAFLGLAYAPEARRYLEEEFTPSMTGSRREALAQLTREERAILRRVVEPTSAWLGYSEP